MYFFEYFALKTFKIVDYVLNVTGSRIKIKLHLNTSAIMLEILDL